MQGIGMQESRKLLQSKCMRIGVFDPYLDDLGGGEKYMMSVASCLSKKHDVTVFWDRKEDFEVFKKR